MNFRRMALALILVQNTLPPPLQTASISGIVVEAGTGRPVANATIQLAANSSGPNPAPLQFITRSGGDGTFTLANLKAGDGQLGIMAPGYVSEIYRGAGNGRMVWTANQKLTDIRIELTPTATITGRIVNQQGDPVRNIAVQAVQLSYMSGKKQWRVVEARPTNDLGEYRLFWLNPGRYFIRTVQGDTVATSINLPMQQTNIDEKLDVQPPVLIRSLANDGSTSDEAVLPIYYPGTPESSQAVAVDIHPGQTARIDFQSSRVSVHRVRGRIAGGSVESGSGSTVRLVPFNANSAQVTVPDDFLDLESLIEENSFDIGGVPPGSYAVLVDLHRNGTAMSARTTIDVRNTDVNDLVITPTPKVRIVGSFLIESDSNDDRSSGVSAQLQLRSKTSDTEFFPGFIVNSVLTFENVPADDYSIDSFSARLEVPGNSVSSPAYIESIRAGGQDVLLSGLHVDSSFDQPLRIVVRNDFGSVSGRVTGSSSQFTEAVVLLFPSIRNDRARYKMTGVDATGDFHFKDVAPGDYKLFASGLNDYDSWQDPEFVAAHEVYGRDIRVTAGNDRTVDIPFISGVLK